MAIFKPLISAADSTASYSVAVFPVASCGLPEIHGAAIVGGILAPSHWLTCLNQDALLRLILSAAHLRRSFWSFLSP